MFQRNRRWPSDALVNVVDGDRHVRAEVSDVSETGLLVSCSEIDAAPGEMMTLTVSRLEFSGLVRWRSGPQYGLSFDPPLVIDVLRELTDGAFRPGKNGRGTPLLHTL